MQDGPAARVDRYAERVVAGEIPACRYVRLACKRHLDDRAHGAERGLLWDEDAAAQAIDWFESMLKHSTGSKFAGRPFLLSEWQAFFVGSVFGWFRAPGHERWIERFPVSDNPAEDVLEDTGGTRRFRNAFCEVPRKNGKTTMAGGIALLLLVGDFEPGAQVYSTATLRKQARIVFDEARNMVAASPGLRRKIKVLEHNMHCLNPMGKFEPLSRQAKSAHGFNPSGCIHDELHLHKDRSMYDVIRTGQGARAQPLNITITTAGEDEASVWGEERQRLISVLEGRLPDDTYFGVIYTIDQKSQDNPEGDSWDDPRAWIKANPNIGVSVSLAYLRERHLEAQASPSAQSSFKTYHLDVPVGALAAYFNVEEWRACARPGLDLAEFAGWQAFQGIDLATLRDIAARASLFRQDTGKTRQETVRTPEGEETVEVPVFRWGVHVDLYVPERRLHDQENKNREAYQKWKDEGWLHTTKGAATDFRVIEAAAVATARRFDVIETGLDPWNANQMAVSLEDQGITAVQVPMNTQNMSPALKTLRNVVTDELLVHDGNPVLDWMIGNVVAREDANDNVFPRKEKGKEATHKIDGVVAILLAMSRALVYEDSAPGLFVV